MLVSRSSFDSYCDSERGEDESDSDGEADGKVRRKVIIPRGLRNRT